MRKNLPLITLHSGALGTIPNSLEYLETAASLKPDIIEVDVRRTKDRTAVLCHDPYITVEGTRYDLKEHNLVELQEMMPELLTLREALRYSRENKLFLNLDLKTQAAADSLIYELESLRQASHIIVSGCDSDQVEYLRDKVSDLRVLLNVEDRELDAEPAHYMERVKEIVARGSRIGSCGLNVNFTYCREELIRYASLRSLPVMVWTIDEAEEMKRFSEMGVYSITTNRIDLLRRVYEI